MSFVDYSSPLAAQPPQVYPWGIEVPIFGAPLSHVTWNSLTTGTSFYKGIAIQSSAAVDSELQFKVALGSGVYRLDLLYLANTNIGILTAYLDGVSLGTIDGYAASATKMPVNAGDAGSSIAGVVVSTPGIHTLKLKVTGKNASATQYYWQLSGLSVTRTS
jgi:hypothetical protein